MIRFALKGLLTRKLRTALTAIAIILGVATVSGTFVLTDSIDKAFDSIFSDVYKGTDATITSKSAFDLEDQSGTTEAAFDESLLGRVKQLPDVADAIGGVATENAQLVKDGKAIVFGGAPNLGFSVDPSKPEFSSLTLVDGAWPGPDEVVIDKATADKKDLEVGAPIGVQVEGPVENLRISGIVKFGSVSSIGGATLAGFDLPDGAEAVRQGGQARPDPRVGQARRRACAARLRDREDPPPERPGAHRKRAGGRRTRRAPTSSSRSCATSCSRSA